MINHVSIGVRDIAKSKRFYDAAFAPLGYCGSASASIRSRQMTSLVCISALRRQRARAWMAFTPRPYAPADATTASLACVPTTGPTTTLHSSSIRTAIVSKPTAVGRSEATNGTTHLSFLALLQASAAAERGPRLAFLA